VAYILFDKPAPEDPPPDWPSFRKQAVMWAETAVAVYNKLPTEERPECDQMCVAAKSLLAEACYLVGNYDRAISIMKSVETEFHDNLPEDVKENVEKAIADFQRVKEMMEAEKQRKDEEQ
jgi:hypothetical protein